MDSQDAIALVMRWVHVLCAVAVGGSIIFHWLVLRPAANKTLSPDQHRALREALMKRWKMLIHPSILLFLASGFYNYIRVTGPLHEGQGLYHALFGVKFLIGIAVFAIAVVLTSTRKWSENWREGRLGWALLAVGVIAMVLIGGYMKRMPSADSIEPDVPVGLRDVPSEYMRMI
jgi:uncharacterized membrane protein